MSDRVIIDSVILGEWIQKAFREGRNDGLSLDTIEDIKASREFWRENRDQIQRDLENNSLVLPYENRRVER